MEGQKITAKGLKLKDTTVAKRLKWKDITLAFKGLKLKETILNTEELK